MAEILINALSVTNQSGLHVLVGHLNQLAGEFHITVLARQSMTELRERLGGRVHWIDAPEKTARWLPRTLWEFQGLEKTARDAGARFYFTPSGIAASRLSIPQVVLCQNPWALVPSARRRRDALKAWLQRRAYRKTMRRAEVMVFNSNYMQQAYRKNAGLSAGSPRSRPPAATDCRAGAENPPAQRKSNNPKRLPSEIVIYQAADEETRERSEHWKDRPRNLGQIVCVSAMAPHKNVEALVQALAQILHNPPRPAATPPVEENRNGVETKSPPLEGCQNGGVGSSSLSIQLVGSWPDAAYEQKIRNLVSELNLEKQIQFAGFVSREKLDRFYAESQVFCLMSRCESFGIPAIEAQLFGTPVVCSTACAVPEICGDGGLFCDPDDIAGIADALQSLLDVSKDWKNSGVEAQPPSNDWKKYSEQARANADRFRWQTCSQPLVSLFENMCRDE